ncbi:DUF2157 domain-containing protein [Campylobacter sp. MIT 97-5078]|uniref:DUF2157 domain-containing protein n=1 Tax=Campylobacter sp. MIT 97-5078 TaxID=1548153 RepID=UPI000513EF86|nr:DUF2157 domain-containing protein [Campylobacter sp. MIT 97-5078]KGI56794.1 hypothetical protein LR59_04710 [Campylobacter sp. MIT 97-5078]TQR27303.1 DUF2157 domain-containing protein [Campylobacter sp. MIT 97-5078]
MIFALNKFTFLKSEFEKLQAKGLLSKAQSELLLSAYEDKKDKNTALFLVLGFVFVALALLLLVAYNWQELSNLIKTSLLLVLLLCSQLGVYLSKTKAFLNAFAFLSNFVLLANLALLSQIYHLGDNTPLAFLSVALLTLLQAWVLKSFLVFAQSLAFALVYFCLGFDEFEFSSFFIIFVLISLAVNAFKNSQFLAFFNFFSLCAYVYFSPFLFDAFNAHFSSSCLYFACFALVFLSLKSHENLAFFTLMLAFLVLSMDNFEFVSIDFNLHTFILIFKENSFCWLLSFLLIFNLLLKRYFLAFLALAILILILVSGAFITLFASFISLILGVYLLTKGHLWLGLFGILALAFIRYVNLIGDYLSASGIFLLFALAIFTFIGLKKLKQNKGRNL